MDPDSGSTISYKETREYVARVSLRTLYDWRLNGMQWPE